MTLGCIPTPKDEQTAHLHLLYEEQVGFQRLLQIPQAGHHQLEEVTVHLQITPITVPEEVLLPVRQATIQAGAVPVAQAIQDLHQIEVVLPEAGQVHQAEEGTKTA